MLKYEWENTKMSGHQNIVFLQSSLAVKFLQNKMSSEFALQLFIQPTWKKYWDTIFSFADSLSGAWAWGSLAPAC